VWLTAVQAGADEADGAASAWLPGPTRWRSVTVAAVQRRVLAGRPGRWWVAAGSALDTGAELPPAVQPSWAHPDATAVLPLAERRLRRPGGGFLHGARHDRRRFDGVLLAPMPADHPEAYRCYGRAVLEACAAKLHAGGTVAVRTQATAGRVADALAVARTFAKAVGSGWAAVAGRDGHVDVLLVAGQPPVSLLGPIAQPGAEAGEWAYIVPLGRLRLPGVARSDQLARSRLLLPTVAAEQLRRHLGRAGP